MSRVLAAVYGVLSYLLFFVTFLYLIGFVSGYVVPKHVDSGVAGPVALALAIDVLLIALFGIQHSVMARPAFKRWITRFVSPAIERSTYVLMASLTLVFLFWQWRPLGGEIWRVEQPIARMTLLILQAAGWLVVLFSTFLVSHFELFGVKQVYDNLRRRPPTPHRFVTPLLYRLVRHPIMVGFLMAFWITPVMTVGRLLFAIGMTTYIMVGVRYEERDLVQTFGDEYERYRGQVPAFIPGLGDSARTAHASTAPKALS
jgi:protein-S-isoprenylcysteine O-methyltransferase Ste14